MFFLFWKIVFYVPNANPHTTWFFTSDRMIVEKYYLYKFWNYTLRQTDAFVEEKHQRTFKGRGIWSKHEIVFPQKIWETHPRDL